jgi:hypothetical protein
MEISDSFVRVRGEHRFAGKAGIQAAEKPAKYRLSVGWVMPIKINLKV